jgi:hypothetical protein
MDLLFKYTQEKKENKNENKSSCELLLMRDKENIEFVSIFNLDYKRYGEKHHVMFTHVFNVNICTADILVTYKITNRDKSNNEKVKIIKKNNCFKSLSDLIENGIMKGEKYKKYWGVKYERATNKIFESIYEILKPFFKNEFTKEKIYIEKYVCNPLYDLLVDYHLDIKQIKGHDNIYNDIKNDYPKKKYLKKNDNKFLQSILDEYKIKSKYLVSELNKNTQIIHIKSLNYLCKLFGDNYLEYLKKINWVEFCQTPMSNRKVHFLKNDSEKKSLVRLFNNLDQNVAKYNSIINDINKLLSIRDFLDKKDYLLKFNAKNDDEFEYLFGIWGTFKQNINRGYKLKYTFSDEFIEKIEEDIVLDDKVFKPKILITEEDFIVEGFKMKNCMGKQFSQGTFYIYISLCSKNKCVNLQFKRGELTQQYGKANSDVPDSFVSAIKILSEKMKNYKFIEYKKEKYNLL